MHYMLGGSRAYASSHEKILKIWCNFCAFWCIIRSDCVLTNSLKSNIYLYKTYFYTKIIIIYMYRYTLAIWGTYIAPGEIFENMLQLKRFGL